MILNRRYTIRRLQLHVTQPDAIWYRIDAIQLDTYNYMLYNQMLYDMEQTLYS